MRIAVTGTPGTGKTTAVARLAERIDMPVIHLNELIEVEGLHRGTDPDRNTRIADLERLEEQLSDRTSVLFESHLAHLLSADRVVVLRCRPAVLERRLLERGEPSATARENAESEALDLILAEAVERHGRERVFEIETTDRPVSDVAATMQAVIEGDRAPSAGTVDYTDYL